MKIRRGANGTAHQLAQRAISKREMVVKRFDIPSSLRQLAVLEASGSCNLLASHEGNATCNNSGD